MRPRRRQFGAPAVAAVFTMLAILAPASPVEPAAGGGEPGQGNYQFDDDRIVYLGQVGDAMPYRDGDLLVVLRPKRGGGLADTSSYQVKFTTDAGAAAIRVTDASGVTRVARKVDLYRREEVAFRSGKVSLAGTLFVPFGAGPHPAVVLAHGSGPRDGRGLLLMADLFARNGIAALAYDKRGSGDSTGSYRTIGADFRSLAEDVVTRAMTVLYRAVRSLGLVERGQASWDLDPAAAWARVRQPVLLIYGEHDRLVPPAQSASVITQALAEAGNAGHTVVRFAGTDHGIFVSEDGFRSPQDYERGSLRFGAGYLDTMVDWVRATAGQPSPVSGWRPGPVEGVPDVDRRPWHENPALHLGLGAVLLAVFACAVLAPPAQGIVRRLRHRGPDAWPPGVRRARRWAWLASASGLLVLLAATALTVVFAGAPATAMRVGLRAMATVTTLVVVALVAATALAWREPWPGRARLGHGAVVATAVATLGHALFAARLVGSSPRPTCRARPWPGWSGRYERADSSLPGRGSDGRRGRLRGAERRGVNAERY